MGANIKDLKEEEEKIQIQGEMLARTCGWHGYELQRRMARLQTLKKKIDASNEIEECWFEEADKLQKEINHFEKKANWEKKEIDKFNQKCEKFEEIKHKNFMADLSKKLSLKLNGSSH